MRVTALALAIAMVSTGAMAECRSSPGPSNEGHWVYSKHVITGHRCWFIRGHKHDPMRKIFEDPPADEDANREEKPEIKHERPKKEVMPHRVVSTAADIASPQRTWPAGVPYLQLIADSEEVVRNRAAGSNIDTLPADKTEPQPLPIEAAAVDKRWPMPDQMQHFELASIKAVLAKRTHSDAGSWLPVAAIVGISLAIAAIIPKRKRKKVHLPVQLYTPPVGEPDDPLQVQPRGNGDVLARNLARARYGPLTGPVSSQRDREVGKGPGEMGVPPWFQYYSGYQ
jgi:hypothetical protein